MFPLAYTHDFRPNKLALNSLNIHIHTNNRTCIDQNTEHVKTKIEDADISNLMVSELTATSCGKHIDH